MKSSRNSASLMIAAALAATGAGAGAQAPNNDLAAETAKLNAEAAVANAQAGVANAEAARINAEAGRDKARIESLGLPSFEGKTTLSGTGAGAMEASMLAMHALQAAAGSISDAVCNRAAAATGAATGGCTAKPNRTKYLVLAGPEALDLSVVSAMKAQMAGMRQQFEDAGIGRTQGELRGLFAGPAGVISGINALAGLLRTETTVTATDVSSVSERALANAVASRLGGHAYLPGAAIGKIPADAPLLVEFEQLVQLRRLAAAAAAVETNAARKEDLSAAISRFDTFSTKVSTADEKGSVPIVRAARLDALADGDPPVLRIHVDKSGGTFIQRKNLGTHLGLDPLRVTGAVIASYSVTEPGTGKLIHSNIYVCRTGLSRLRPIHDANWKGAGGTGKALCTPMS